MVDQVATRESDVEALHRMGYAQELRRRMSGFSNFAVSFTIISILSGCLTAYGGAMNNGGPVDMNIGWPLVGIFVTIVGLAMAEVCSSYPTAGGLYYWSAKLGGANSAAWSWFTGWFNLLGQVAVTAGIDGGLALFASAFLNNWLSYPLDAPHILLVYAVALFLHGLLNTFGVRLVAVLNNISVWWHIVGVVVIVAVLLIVPSHHQSIGFIFGHFQNNTGASFSGAPIYVLAIGLLLAQYTFTGYDASAHMTEETHNAAVAGPRGIVMSILVSLVAGWILLIGVTAAIQNYSTEAVATVPAAQIFIDAAGGGLGQFLLLIAIGAQFYCGMSSVTANSRMIYAFSRDGAVPGHRLWHKVNKRTRTPTNADAAIAQGLRAIVYIEVFALEPAAAERRFTAIRERVVETELVRIGVSPHAPYTCSVDVYRWCLGLGIPVGTVKSRLHRGRIALAKELGLGTAREQAGPPPAPAKAKLDTRTRVFVDSHAGHICA